MLDERTKAAARTDTQLATAVAQSERQLAAHREAMRLMREAYGFSSITWTVAECCQFGQERTAHDAQYDRWLILKQEQCRRRQTP